MIAPFPAEWHHQLDVAVHAAYAAGMNAVLLVSGLLALAGAVGAVTLIRSRDFIHTTPAERAPATSTDP